MDSGKQEEARGGTQPEQPTASAAKEQPESSQVYGYLMYGLSLPERALRATTAVVGGTINESAALLVPQAFRSSKSYEVFVQQMLDFMVNDVGGVEKEGEESEQEIESFVARKAVGSFIDLAGMATLHLSPLTVLAIMSDVAYGSQTYLAELSAELKRAGVIDEDTTIDHAADLLEAIRKTSEQTADALDLPPVSVAGLQETLEQTQQAVRGIDPTKLLPQAEMQQLWDDMHEMADREGVGILDVSSTMTLYSLNKVGQVGQGALSSVKVAGNMFDRHIFDHYRQGLTEIRENGLYATLSEASQPYVAAVWTNFSSEKETITEDLFSGRLIGQAWTGVRGWLGGQESQQDESDGSSS
jgi:hypothetical protein